MVLAGGMGVALGMTVSSSGKSRSGVLVSHGGGSGVIVGVSFSTAVGAPSTIIVVAVGKVTVGTVATDGWITGSVIAVGAVAVMVGGGGVAVGVADGANVGRGVGVTVAVGVGVTIGVSVAVGVGVIVGVGMTVGVGVH